MTYKEIVFYISELPADNELRIKADAILSECEKDISITEARIIKLFNTYKEYIMDNIHNMPEPILTNISKYCDSIYYSEDKKELFIGGAEYGYNIAQVFVNDLKEEIKQLNAKIEELKK